MKKEWRKTEKEIYLPKRKPEIITLPKMNYITIIGQGNPGNEEFSNCVQALSNISRKLHLQGYTVYVVSGG